MPTAVKKTKKKEEEETEGGGNVPISWMPTVVKKKKKKKKQKKIPLCFVFGYASTLMLSLGTCTGLDKLMMIRMVD